MNRTLDVARIQLVNWRSTVGQPLLILAVIFVMNLAVFLAISVTVGRANPDATFYSSGAGIALFFVVGLSHLTTMTQFFPFLLGLSVTRRDFYLGSVLFVVAQAVAFGVLFAIGQVVELATGGWGSVCTSSTSAPTRRSSSSPGPATSRCCCCAR